MAGYGTDVWTAGGDYSFVPCVAPFVGALIGGAIYDFFIFTGDSPMNREQFGWIQLKEHWHDWRAKVHNNDEKNLPIAPEGLPTNMHL